jgi:hypothetical protein
VRRASLQMLNRLPEDLLAAKSNQPQQAKTQEHAHVRAPEQVVESGGASVSISAQDLLNPARQKLLQIGEPASLRPE